MSFEIERILAQWIHENPEAVANFQNSSKIQNKKQAKRKKKENQSDFNTKVADIIFEFDNSELLLALKARGAKIAENDFDGMREEEKNIEFIL